MRAQDHQARPTPQPIRCPQRLRRRMAVTEFLYCANAILILISNWGTIDITGLMLFQYGCAKILKIPAESPFAKVELTSLYGAAGMIELILGALLLLGLFTRPIAFILSGEMAFAYFISHAPRSFFPVVNNGSLAIALSFACLYLATSGGGPISLDALLRKKA
jgi:putative oxidoreductase